MKKLLSLVLALAMVLSLAACGNKSNTTPDDGNKEPDAQQQQPVDDTPKTDDRLAAEVYVDYDASNYYAESDALYEATLGGYYEYYQASMTANSMAERYALQALAEGKLLGSGVFLPSTTQGGAYTISRVVPGSVNTTLWGNSSDRYETALVTTELIKPADRDEIKAHWAEVKGTGTFLSWARDFLTEKGYTLKDTYTVGYTSDANTWDYLNTYRTADSEKIVLTLDGLLSYDVENTQVPALAESYEVSDDGLTYTFHIRQGAVWTDSQGRKVADVTADDWVAAMQHLLDAQGGLEGIAADDAAHILNAQKYIDGEITDFSQVGVKAVDTYTLVYTLDRETPYFLSMLAYNIFAPMSRAYYASQGGKFGAEFDSEAASYLYGSDPDHIAYCGPYLVTNATEKNTIVYKANDSYWNKDAVNVKTLTWLFNDGTDDLKAYNDAKAGTIDGAGLNTASIAAAKADGLFDEYAYISNTNATTYCGFLNINRHIYANYNDPTVAVSTMTVTEADRSNAALQNLHFRHAVLCALDRGSYNAQTRGEDLKFTNMRNMYVPGTFVQLPEAATVSVNGTSKTFPAGTYYGAIVQAQLDADGVEIKVWDPEADGGIGSSDGFDGWYNPTYAKSELAKAIEELAAADVEISAENPIKIDVPYFSGSETYTNRANVLKQSIESVLESKVIINLVPCESAQDWYYAGYYPDYGYEMNANFMDVSGWGPDYGEPQTYLTTMTPAPGGMVKSCGMY